MGQLNQEKRRNPHLICLHGALEMLGQFVSCRLPPRMSLKQACPTERAAESATRSPPAPAPTTTATPQKQSPQPADTTARKRNMLRFFTAALLVAAVAADDAVAVAASASNSLNLPAFSAIDIGYRGCMPFSVTVQSGSSYTFTLDGASVCMGDTLRCTIPARRARNLEQL